MLQTDGPWKHSKWKGQKTTNTVWFLLHEVPAAAKLLQSCPTLCDPIDGSPPCSAVPDILQARTMEWDSISFSNAWKWKGKVKSLSRVWLLATPRTEAHEAPSSMGFSRQEYWSGVPLPSPHEVPRTAKFIEAEGRREVTRSQWENWMRNYSLMISKFLFGMMKNSETRQGDDYTILWMYLMPLNCLLKNG